MDEKKKTIFTVFLGLAWMWLIFSNFCLPSLKDNVTRLAEYRRLREETKLIEGLSDEKFQIWDERLSKASATLAEKFLGEGKMKLAEELTSLPIDTNIVFSDIKQKETETREDCEVFPLDFTLKAQFPDLVKYLATLETSTLLVGIESLRVTKPTPDAKDLDVWLTFVGFRLIPKSKPVNEYLAGKFTPFDESNFKNLIGPVSSRPGININSVSALYNPFLSVYDPAAAQKKTVTTKAVRELALRGTLRIAGKNAALINEAVVREGDKIDGMEVVQIGDGKVVLLRSGKRYILKMGVGDGFIRP